MSDHPAPTAEHTRHAAHLYEMRDTARRLRGDRYVAQMAELGRILTMIAEREGQDVLSAAIDVCRRRELVGMDKILILAAAVELTEPTGGPG